MNNKNNTSNKKDNAFQKATKIIENISRSVKTYFEIIANGDNLLAKAKVFEKDWYFSNEGKKAYNEAKSPAAKVLYFYNYLTAVKATKLMSSTYARLGYSLACKNSHESAFIKVAYVMMNSMDKSSFEFAGYPNILSPEKNPIVKYLSTSECKEIDADTLLKLIRNDSCDISFENLTQFNQDRTVSDMYKIERDIIVAFSSKDERNSCYSQKSFIYPYYHLYPAEAYDFEYDSLKKIEE